MADFTGKCPHRHCKQEYDVSHAENVEELHFTCDQCLWPLLVTRRQRDEWQVERGHWGPAGHETEFHELVCALFNAEQGAVNYGIDCLSGQCGSDEYDGIEAKRHDRPVGPGIVRDVHKKYGRLRDVRLAIVTGVHGFTDAAIEEAAKKDTHLYLVLRTATHYAPRRVA